jgi:hypothetical protein
MGIAAVVLGISGSAYFLYGIYLFFKITDLLYFLTPDYSGLAMLVLFFMISLTLTYFGFRLAWPRT